MNVKREQKQKNLLIRNCDFLLDPFLAITMSEQEIHETCARLVYGKFPDADVVENKKFRLSRTPAGTYELREQFSH